MAMMKRIALLIACRECGRPTKNLFEDRPVCKKCQRELVHNAPEPQPIQFGPMDELPELARQMLYDTYQG